MSAEALGTGSEAARLRRCRELFEAASAAGVTLDEQRRREARARWQAADRRMADRCAARLVDAGENARPTQWWQR